MVGTVLIALTWVLLWLAFVGVGWLTAYLLRVRLSAMTAFFVGFGVVLAALQWWHLAFPINDAARLFLLLLPAWFGGLLRFYTWMNDAVYGRASWMLRIAPSAAFTVGAILLLLLIANRSIDAPNETYDTGVYHLNAVRWSAEYPVVPGLGNLHSRLAFSDSYFLYPALLDRGIWQDRSYHIANGLLFWAACLVLLLTALDRSKPVSVRRYHALFLPVILFVVLANGAVPGIANDPPLYIFGVIIGGQTLQLLLSRDDAAMRSHLLVIVLLGAVGTAIKLSFAVLGGGFALVALVVWLRGLALTLNPSPHRRFAARRGTLKRLFQRGLIVIAVPTVLIILPMLARTAIQTGYPLYPTQFIVLPVEWRVDSDYATLEYNFIRSSARIIGAPLDETLSGWGWLSTWAANILREYYHFTLPLLLSVFSLVFLTVSSSSMFNQKIADGESTPSPSTGRDGVGSSFAFGDAQDPLVGERPCALPGRPRGDRPYTDSLTRSATSNRVGFIMIIIPLFAALFWFVSAPAIRFAGATFWLIALGLLLPVMEGRPRLFWVILLLVSLPTLRLFVLEPMIPPGDAEYGLHTLTQAELNPYTTDSGLDVWTPAGTNQCWDAPLPCTPYPHPNLRLRVPGALGQGFILNIGPDDPPQVID